MTNTKTAAKAAPKKKRRASLDKRKSRAGWFFVLPFVLGFIIIYLPIIFESIRLSFFRIKPITGGGFDLIPVGWQNYQGKIYAFFSGYQLCNYIRQGSLHPFTLI